MKRRLTLAFCLLAILALSILQLRPVAADVLNIPPEVRTLKVLEHADGTHCQMVADCHFVTASTALFDVSHTPLMPILAGVIVLIMVSTVRPVIPTVLPVTSPPPRSRAV